MSSKDLSLAVRLHVDTDQMQAELSRAGKAVQDFSRAGAGGLQAVGAQAPQLGSVSAALDGVTAAVKKNVSATTSLKTSTADTSAQSNFLALLREQIALQGKSTEEILRYRAAQLGAGQAASPLILQLQNQRAAQQLAADAARQEQAAQREAAQAKKDAGNAQASFLAGLREQVALQGKSSAEALRYRAGKLGVGAEAEEYIRQIGLVESGTQRLGMSAKATAAAMRGVPAQFTDIATSLQGGQAPLTVFLQQGGQLKDMFGGAGNAARALGGYMLGLVNPFTVSAVAAAAVGYAMYKGAEQQRAFQGALIVSGNAAGATAGQLEAVYAATAKATGQFGASQDAVIGLVKSRQVAADQLQAVATSIVRFSQATGIETQALVDDFTAIGREPVQAVVKLHEKYGILTAATLQQARALVDQGKAQEAAALVQGRAADEIDKIGKAAKDNIGNLEGFWRAVKGGAGGVVQSVMDWGKDTLPEQDMAKQQALVEQLKARLANAAVWEKAELNIRLQAAQAQLEKAGAQTAVDQALAKVKGELNEENDRAMAGLGKLNTAYDQHMGKQEQLIKQLAELKKARDDALKAPGIDVADVEKKYAADVAGAKRQYGPSYDLASLMHSLLLQESGNRQFRDDGSVVRNAGSGATGIAQIVPKYGADYARMAGVEWSPELLNSSAEYGKKLAEAGIKTYLKMFDGDLEKALSAYNAGPGTVQKAVKAAGVDGDWKAAMAQFQSASNFNETKNYRAQILGRLPQDSQGDYASALGAAPDSGFEKELLKSRERLAKTTAEADAAQRGLTQSQKDFEALQLSPAWAAYNDTQRAALALNERQSAVNERLAKTTGEGNQIKAQADAQEAANATFGQSKVAVEAWKAAQLGANAAVAQALGQSPQLVAGLQRTAEEQERYVAALKAADYKQTIQGLEEWKRSASEQAKLYQDEALLAGLTAKERAMVVAARQVELKLAKQIADINKNDSLTPEQKERAIGLANEAATIEKNAAVAKVVQDDWAKTSDQINQSLTDALMRGFESGKDFGKNLRDTLVNMFKTTTLRPVISAVMAPVSGVVNGVVSSGLNAVGLGSGSGVGSVLNLGSSAYGALSGNSVLGSAASFAGNALGITGAGGTLAIGAGNAASASILAAGGTAAEAAAAAGAAAASASSGAAALSSIGAALGPIALGIGALMVVSSMMSKGDTRFGSQYHFTAGDGLKIVGGPNQGVDYGGQGAAQTAAVDGINALFKRLGSSESVDRFASGFESSEKGKGFSYAGGVLGNGSVFGQGIGGLGYQNNRGSMSPEQALASYQNELKQATLQALQSATDIPKAIAEQLKGVDIDQLSGAELDKLIGAVDAQILSVDGFRAAVATLPFSELASLSFDAAAGLVAAAGGLDNLKSGLVSYYENFYSDGEKTALVTGQISETLAALNVTMPATRDEFRAQMDAAVALGDAGAPVVAALLSVNQAFASIVPSAADAANAVASAAAQMAQAAAQMQAKLSSVVSDYLNSDELRSFRAGEIQSQLAAGGINLTRDQILSASKDDARALYEQYAAQGNAAAQNAILDAAKAFADLTAQQAQAASGGRYWGQPLALEGGNGGGATLSEINSLKGSSAAVMNEWQSICDSLIDEMKRVRGELVGKGREGLAYAQAQFAIATAQARAGDQDAAKSLPALNRTVLELAESNASTLLELRRAQAAQLESLQTTSAGIAARAGLPVPAFANGGLHAGGLRLVGERGPELEVTGPSRIYTAEQTRSMLSSTGASEGGGELAGGVRALVSLMQRLLDAAHQGNGYGKEIEGLLARVTEKGSAMRTKAVTA